ncbi:MAG: hypothetical protein Q8O67_21565 [Deltaproteobacteria bacterium]|nr:hypothetical protein [Deltaproteobacteria bacterium]
MRTTTTTTLLLLCLAACLPPLAPPGLAFHHIFSDPALPETQPLEALRLVEGQTAVLFVRTADNEGVEIDKSAVLNGDTPSPDKAVVVEVIPPEVLVVSAAGGGDGVVEITAFLRGTEIEPEVFFGVLPVEVAKPGSVEVDVNLACGGSTVLLPTDQPVLVPHVIALDSGPLAPFAPVVIEAAPATALRMEASPDHGQAWVGRTGGVAGVVELSAGGEVILTLRLVAPQEVDGARLEPFDGGPTDAPLAAGETRFLNVRGLVGGEPVCQQRLNTALRSLTPETCVVRATPLSAVDDAPDLFGLVGLEALRPGACNYEVAWADAAGGAGLATVFAVDIIDP